MILKKNDVDVVITDTSVDSKIGTGNGSKRLEGGFKFDVDSGTNGANQQLDCMHRPPTFASFLHEESSQNKVNFHTLDTKQTDLADSHIIGLYIHGVLEHGLWLIRNASFILRKLTQSSKFSKEELTFVHVCIKFHGVHCPKHVLADLRKQRGTSNDDFQTVQRKAFCGPRVNKQGTRDNGKPVDDLVDNTRKNLKAPPMKYGIWSGRKADSPKRNVIFFPETKLHYFDRDDMEFDDMKHVVEKAEHRNASRENG
ncbi:hypothetical protein Tco_1212691 [Tanacetum coccineum]